MCLLAYVDSEGSGSAYTSMQSDQGLHYLLTELFDTIEYIIGEQMPRQDFAHVPYKSKSVHFVCVGRHLFCLMQPITSY